MNPGRTTPDDSPGRGWLWLAFAWGLAEATFFFIVPDVLTSRLVLRRPKSGFAACFASLAGALLGGALLFFLGRHSAPQLLGAFDHLPGINPALVDRARVGLVEHGPVALFTGVLGGIPYKLYATQAAGTGMGAGIFLLTTVFARLSRFLLVTGLAWLVGAKLLPNSSLAAKLRIQLGAWLLFYFLYFRQLGV
jgi:membrane protein YqaA with SNARE-associated domain